jgi:radical SAM superfamily enzyme YgiQ (UPF0313 family)
LRVLLVNPPDCSQGGVSNPVLGLLYLASYIRDIAEVQYIDGFIEGWEGYYKRLEEFRPDVVGVQMLTPGRHQALKVLEIAKQKGCTTIAGGPHASIMAGQIRDNYKFVDYIVKGEGEYVLRAILEGTSPGILESTELLDIDSIPYPAWDLGYIDSDRYIGNADIRVPIIASRGCKGNCTFCSTHKVWRKYRARSAENVVGEIEWIVKDFNKTHFVFEDDSLSCDIEKSKELLKLLISKNLGIRFFATMRADGIDSELAGLLKQAGCYGVSIGFESGSPRVLKAYNKLITVEQNIKAAKVVKEANLKLCALMIYNGLFSNRETGQETANFLNEIKPDDVGTLSQLWVLPGTKIYEMMKEQGFINDNFWLGTKPYYVYKGELD